MGYRKRIGRQNNGFRVALSEKGEYYAILMIALLPRKLREEIIELSENKDLPKLAAWREKAVDFWSKQDTLSEFKPDDLRIMSCFAREIIGNLVENDPNLASSLRKVEAGNL